MKGKKILSYFAQFIYTIYGMQENATTKGATP
jgi:hypothetical protein